MSPRVPPRRENMTLRCPSCVALLTVVVLGAGCAAQAVNSGGNNPTLRQYADRLGIGIGAAIQGKYWAQDPELRTTLAREFNQAVSIIPMKFTEPEEGKFDFSSMDRDIQFAREHDMRLFGTTLIYRNDEAAPWLRFNGFFCGSWSPDTLDREMRNYIQTLVQHGGASYFAWDVVNEPMAPGHNRCWSRILGYEQTIAKAFRYARAGNPHTLLVLNDTFGHAGLDRNRVDTFFDLIRRLKSQGVPIDVAGTEMHLYVQQLHPDYISEFKYFLGRARSLGVKVHITELDVYQGPSGQVKDPWQAQKDVYYNVVRTCIHDTNCGSITVFGVSDRYSWLRTNLDMDDARPLLFDDNYQKKPAYYGVLQALKEGRDGQTVRLQKSKLHVSGTSP